MNITDEQTAVGRCGWIVLVFVLLFLHGILPGTFPGGIAGLKAADVMLLRQHTGSDLVIRLLVLAGMIVSFLVLALISMVGTMVASRMIGNRIKRSTISDSPAPSCQRRK